MLHVQADAAATAQAAANWLTDQACAKDGPFALCLAGGSTPKILYTLLAQEPWCSRFPWNRTHIFFGDERFVPHNHPDSNYHMATQALLAHVPLPASHIYPMPVDGTPQEAAQRYAEQLQNFSSQTAQDTTHPFFDVVLLGLGDDGHTASLFPGTSALAEQNSWVTAVLGAKPEARLTLTYPALNSSHNVAFLVTGTNKSNILNRVFNQDSTYPASHIKPVGKLHWFVDQAAGHGLQS